MPFPDTFWWGTASSSTQCEGAAPESDWLAWERAGKAPPSGAGNGFATRYAEDFALLRGHGLTHHRLSIEWARIEPREGRRDDAAVEHYRQVLTAARDAGVAPWVCLHHFTLPGWFTEVGSGGFLDERARSYYWPRHVAFCAEAFGDLVAGWKPVNEPAAYAAASYLFGSFPPGRHELGDFVDVLGAMLLAQRDAWRELRGGPPVATIHNLSPVFAVGDSPEARQWADAFDEVLWRVWVRAERDGVLALPGRAPVEVPDLREAADLVGFSCYGAIGVRGDGTQVPYPTNLPAGPLGYAPWSEALALVLRRLHDELPGRPLLVCEHGIGTTDDARRCDFLRESLALVEEAIHDGIDVRGFFHWTSVDNYEWLHGYDVPFGLFTRDREPRDSAALLASHANAGTAP